MLADDTYTGAVLSAERLRLAGHWSAALELLGDGAPDRRARAEILTDRFWWQHTGAAEAEAAVDAFEPDDPAAARLLRAELSYTRLLFGLDPRPDDRQRAERGFTAEAGPWGVFWSGIFADHVLHDPALAAERYAAVDAGEPVLRSYVVRHQGGHLLDAGDERGRDMLRESLDLRITAGARPLVAGAAATLAGLGEDRWAPVARAIAEELHLVALLPA
jgi:hypothetical protein